MWQVGVVFAALASFCGAAGDALVRLSFVLEAKRRRKQRHVLLLRQLQRSCSARACRIPNSSSRSSSECEVGIKTQDRPTAEGSSRTRSSERGKDGDRTAWEWQVTSTLSGEAAGGKEAEALRLPGEGQEEQEGELVAREVHEQEEAQIIVPARPFYLRPLWLLGTCLGTVINTLLSIISLDFASASVVTPFAGLHIFWNVIFSRFILQERVLTQHYIGSALVLFGLFFVLCYGVHTPPTLSLQQLLRLYSQNSCVIYFCLSALTLIPCVYIGVFGKDVSRQQRQERERQEQQRQQLQRPKLHLGEPHERGERQQQQLTVRQGRSRVMVYHVVGNERLSGNAEEEGGTSKSSSVTGNHGYANGAAAAATAEMEHASSYRCRSNSVSVTKCQRAVRRTFCLMERDEEELEGVSNRLCEALPEGGRSFSSFSCEDDESVRSASDSEAYSPRELPGLHATAAYPAHAATAAKADSVGAVSRASADRAAAEVSEAAVAARNCAAAIAAPDEDSERSSRHVLLPTVGTAAAAGAVRCDGRGSGGRQPLAEATAPSGKSPMCARGADKRAKQSDDRQCDEDAAGSGQEQQREGSAESFGSRHCMRPSGSDCITTGAATEHEKTWASETSVSSDAPPASKDVENGNSAGPRNRGRHQQQLPQLQVQHESPAAWRASLPAVLQIEVPVALRRFCIAAASGACGGNTNIMMEHVMDVWHTESFASLFHPKFLLLLLVLCLMALGQLTFLNLGLSRYEALYVVPTTMSVLIISSCIGEISVFIHVLELSQTEFLIFAGGALSIVSGIMVLSAADMERQQETSTAERIKEEAEQFTLEREFSEGLKTEREALSNPDVAESIKERTVLIMHLPRDRHTVQGRCIITTTERTRTNFSDPQVKEDADVAAPLSSSDSGAAVEHLQTADEGGSELSGALQQEGHLKTVSQKKRREHRRKKPEEPCRVKVLQKNSRSKDRLATGVDRPALDAGIELYSPAHPAGAVTTVEPSTPHATASRASTFLTVTRHPRSPTTGLLAAAASVPQALFGLVRGSSRGVTHSDNKRHSRRHNNLRSRYQRLRRGTYSCTAAESADEETCEARSSSRADEGTFSHLLNDPESGCCTCKTDEATPQDRVEEFDKTHCPLTS